MVKIPLNDLKCPLLLNLTFVHKMTFLPDSFDPKNIHKLVKHMVPFFCIFAKMFFSTPGPKTLPDTDWGIQIGIGIL